MASSPWPLEILLKLEELIEKEKETTSSETMICVPELMLLE